MLLLTLLRHLWPLGVLAAYLVAVPAHCALLLNLVFGLCGVKVTFAEARLASLSLTEVRVPQKHGAVAVREVSLALSVLSSLASLGSTPCVTVKLRGVRLEKPDAAAAAADGVAAATSPPPPPPPDAAAAAALGAFCALATGPKYGALVWASRLVAVDLADAAAAGAACAGAAVRCVHTLYPEERFTLSVVAAGLATAAGGRAAAAARLEIAAAVVPRAAAGKQLALVTVALGGAVTADADLAAAFGTPATAPPATRKTAAPATVSRAVLPARVELTAAEGVTVSLTRSAGDTLAFCLPDGGALTCDVADDEHKTGCTLRAEAKLPSCRVQSTASTTTTTTTTATPRHITTKDTPTKSTTPPS